MSRIAPEEPEPTAQPAATFGTSTTLFGEATAVLDAQNPWPALSPFTEAQTSFFFGRSAETTELLRLVKRETLTVLYGRSGLGKSSLLQAGLFPLVRQVDALPIHIRLDHSAAAPPAADQILSALMGGAGKAAIETPPTRPGESLWEYFHRAGSRLWTARHRLATPLLVLDQFEELFTSSRTATGMSARAGAFVQDLADLVLNRVPELVKRRLDAGQVDVDEFEFEAPSCKVIIALREDYLPELEGLRPVLRNVMSNCLRLVPMNGSQALDVVRSPAKSLVDDAVARQIVQFVAAGSTGHSSVATDRGDRPEDPASARPGSDGAQPQDPLAELEVEPALLSVVCFELNKKRLNANLRTITPDLLEGNSREILRDFYDRSLGDLPPSVREFVEDELVTQAGHRNRVALDNALAVPEVTSGVLEKLVNRRLLRIDLSNRGSWVELTHDRLTDPIRASRDDRNARNELLRQQARERQVNLDAAKARRQRMLHGMLILGMFCLVLSVVLAVRSHQLSKSMATEQAQKDIAEHEREAAEVQRSLADDKSKQVSALIPGYFLNKVQQSIDGGYGDALRIKLHTMLNGGSLPHEKLFAVMTLQPAFVADAAIKTQSIPDRITFTGNARYLAALGSDSNIQIFAQQPGTLHHWAAIAAPDLKGTAVAMLAHPAPAHGQVLAIRTASGEILFWDCAAGKESAPRLHLPGDAGSVRLPFTMSKNGRRVFAALADGSIVAINSEAPSQIDADVDLKFPTTAPASRPADLAYGAIVSPSGPTSTPSGSVNGPTSEPDSFQLLSSVPIFRDIALENGEKSILESLGSSVRRFDASSCHVKDELKFGQFAISADGMNVAFFAEENHVTIYDESQYKSSQDVLLPGAVKAVAFGPDDEANGLHWAAAAGDNICVVSGSQIEWQLAQPGGTTDVTYRPDGRCIAAGTPDGWITLWRRSDANAPPFDSSLIINALSPSGEHAVVVDDTEEFRLINLKEKPATQPDTRPFVDDSGDSPANMGINDKGAITGVWPNAGHPANAMRVSRWNAGKLSQINLPKILDEVQVARLSRDGTHLAILGDDGMFQSLELSPPSKVLTTIALLADPQHGSSAIGSVVFSPDGTYAIFRRDDERIYATNINKENNHGAMRLLAYSAVIVGVTGGNGSTPATAVLLISGFPTKLKFVNCLTGQEISSIETAYSSDARLAEDGKRLAVKEDKELKLIDTKGQTVWKSDYDASNVKDFCLNDSRNFLVVADDEGLKAIKCGEKDKDAKFLLLTSTTFPHVCCSPDGKYIAGWNEKSVGFFDVNANVLPGAIETAEDSGKIVNGAFTTDSKLFTYTVQSDINHFLQHTMDGGTTVGLKKLPPHASVAVSSPDGPNIFVGLKAGTWQVQNSVSGIVSQQSDPARADVFDSATVVAITDDAKFSAVYLPSEQAIRIFDGPKQRSTLSATDKVSSMAFDDDGTALLLAVEKKGDSNQSELRAVDMDGKLLLDLPLFSAPPDGIFPAKGTIALDLSEGGNRWLRSRLASTDAPEESESGIVLDPITVEKRLLSHEDHAKRLDAIVATEPDESSLAFWSAWQSCQRLRDQLQAYPGEVDRKMLDQAYMPLHHYLDSHNTKGIGDHSLIARTAIEKIELPKSNPAAITSSIEPSELTKPYSNLPAAERQVILRELLATNKPDETVKRNIYVQLAAADMERADSFSDSTIQKKFTDQAMDLLQTAAALPGADSANDTRPEQLNKLTDDPHFPVSLLSVNELNARAMHLTGIQPQTIENDNSAIQLLLLARKKDPKNSDAGIDLAYAYGRIGNRAKELETNEGLIPQVQDMTPRQQATLWGNLGVDYYYFAKPPRRADAFDSLAKSEKADPSYGWSYGHRGQIFMFERDYAQSAANFRKAAEMDSSEARSHRSSAATAFFRMGKREEARKELELIIKQNDADPENWRFASLSLREIHSYSEMPLAERWDSEAIERATAKTGFNVDQLSTFYASRAMARHEMGKYRAAERDAQHALKLSPDSDDCLWAMSIIKRDVGDSAQSVNLIKRSIELGNADTSDWGEIAAAYQRLDPPDLAAASDALDRAVKLNQNWLNTRGRFYLDRGDPFLDKAEADFRASIEAKVEEFPAKLGLARVAIARRRPKAEIQKLLEDVLSKPAVATPPREFLYRAVAQAYLGRFDLAQQELDAARRSEPKDPYVAYFSAEVHALEAASSGPAPASASTRPSHPARPISLAFYDLGLCAATQATDVFNLQHTAEFQIIRNEPAFQLLLTALRKRWGDPNRTTGLADFGATLVARAQADPLATHEFITDCKKLAATLAAPPDDDLPDPEARAATQPTTEPQTQPTTEP